MIHQHIDRVGSGSAIDSQRVKQCSDCRIIIQIDDVAASQTVHHHVGLVAEANQFELRYVVNDEVDFHAIRWTRRRIDDVDRVVAG